MSRFIQRGDFSVVVWSYDELVHAYDMQPSTANAGHVGECTIKGDDSEWYGGFTKTSDASEMLANGWKDGGERLTKLIADVSPPEGKTRRRKVTWRDEGDDLSVDRAMRGDWDRAWRSSVRTITRGPQTVTLFSVWGGNCGLTAEEIFWQGAAAAVISDALENAGYGVRLVAGHVFKDYGHKANHCIQVTIKEETEPMRIDALAAVMCHAGVFRTHGFRAICTAPTDVGYCLGFPRGLAGYEDRLKECDEWPEGSILIGQVTNRASCIEAIKTALAQITD